MPLLFPIESEESLDEGVHEPGDRRYDLLHALAPLAAAQEQDLAFCQALLNSSICRGIPHLLGDVEAVVDEGPEAEECGADLEEEGSGVAVLGEAVVLRDLLVLGVQRHHHDEVPVRRLERI